MKKTLIAFVFTALIFASCSKEYYLSNDLNGTWDVTTSNGIAPTSATSVKFTKKNDTQGDVVVTTSGISLAGTYTVAGDTQIAMTLSGTVINFVVSSHTSKSLTWATDGQTDVLTKR